MAAPKPASHAITLEIRDFAFPSDTVASVGDTVVWINRDALLHTTTADSGAWTSPELGKGNRFSFVAVTAGRFPYHCSAHPVMRSTLEVRE